MMSREVIWVPRQCAPQHALRIGQLTFLQIDLAEKNVRPAEERIEPDRFLERSKRRVPLELSGVSLAEHVISHRKTRIDSYFFLQKLDASFKVSAIDRQLAQQEIGLRELRVDLQRLLQLFLCEVFELLSDHHLRVDQISRCRGGRY